jgi:hypothetical protein
VTLPLRNSTRGADPHHVPGGRPAIWKESVG